MTETKKADQVQKKKFDLGADNVLKTFLTILVPTLIAQLISGTFVVFDTFFVSKGFHTGAVGQGIGQGLFNADAYAALGPAAVSYAMPYTFFIIGVGLMIGAGLATIMTKATAKGDNVTMQNAMNSFVPLSIIFGASLMVLLLIFSKVFVWFGSGFQMDYINSWFNNPLTNNSWGEGWANLNGVIDAEPAQILSQINGHILSQSSWYLRIQAIGAIPYVYMVGGVIMLRVQGKAQYATAFSAVGLVVNIVLDFILIIVLKMNVVGAAIATVVGQLATSAVYFTYFKKYSTLKQTNNNWGYAMSNAKEVLKSGISIMMLQVLTGLVLIIFTVSIGLSNYGEMSLVTNYTAVYQGYNAIFIFLNLIIIGIAQAMSPLISYNAAIGDVEKVKKARRYGLGSSFVFSTISWILIIIFAKQVIGVFYTVNGNNLDFMFSGQYSEKFGGLISIYTNGMKVASRVLVLLFSTFPIAVMITVSGTYLQSVGETKKTSILLFGKVLILIPIILVLILVPTFITGEWEFLDKFGDVISGIDTKANLNIFIALPIVDLIMCGVLVYFLISTEKNVISKMGKNEAKQEEVQPVKETEETQTVKA